MPVQARRLLRKMRGGAQAHLIEADDGRFYVVKFLNNPQHRRILVNEWLGAALLDYLQLAHPEIALVRITDAFLAANPDVYIQLGQRRIAVGPGWHFGSCFPGDPSRSAVYDFLPDALLPKVANLREFLGVLVLDKWAANADARQSIFFRARLRQWKAGSAAGQLEKAFLAQMIDHGYLFNGPYWDFPDSPIQGLYFRPLVYERVRGLDHFQPWLDQVTHFPEEVLDKAWRQIPPEWLEGDEDNFHRLLERLLSRRRRVPDLVSDCRKGRVNPFPNWS